MYKLRHKPTGLFFQPSIGNGNLSLTGKIYQKIPSLHKLGSTIRVIAYRRDINKTSKYWKLLESYFIHNWKDKTYIDTYFTVIPDEWEIYSIEENKSDINLIHPKILEFAKAMDKELKSNIEKGSWEEWGNVEEMLIELEWHKAKLLFAFKDKNKEKIKEYLADCGNYLLMMGNSYKLYESEITKEN